jgi:hypothetical protein
MGFERNHKKQLMMFERKVLRRIFGPTKERDGTWRIKTNDELYELIRHKNTSHKNSKIKLLWPFTSNARRENGKKSI